MRLAILTSHPIQYHAPLFREIARRIDCHVFYAHRATPEQQASAGFDAAFEWDVDLTSGYANSFLNNIADRPSVERFAGCDTPEIGERLRDGRFDALLVTGWGQKSSLQGIWAAKRAGLPVMVRGDSQLDTPRSGLKRAGKSLAYPIFLSAFDAALYVGVRSKAYYRHYRYPEPRLFFSPHCVDNQWFAERATPAARQALRTEIGAAPDEPIVLFAGKLQALKRPVDVVEAAAQARTRPRVMVAGSGAMAAEMQARAHALGVKMDMLGFRNQSQMPAVYAAADVLMLSSDWETWGLVCNEALACGRPILVSSSVGCGDDLAADEMAGARYPTGDAAQAAQALDRLFHSPPTPAAIAARIGRYSLAAAADGVLAALESVKR